MLQERQSLILIYNHNPGEVGDQMFTHVMLSRLVIGDLLPLVNKRTSYMYFCEAGREKNPVRDSHSHTLHAKFLPVAKSSTIQRLPALEFCASICIT